MQPLIIGGLISWVVNLLIGLFVYFANSKRDVNRKFAFFNICIGSWSLGSFLLNTLPDKTIAIWVLRLSYVFAVLLIPAFLRLVYVLIDEAISNRITLVSKLFAVFLIFLLPTRWFIKGIYALPNDGLLISSPGPIYYIFVLGFVIAAYLGFSKLLLAIKASIGTKRNQLRYISAGYLVATIAGLDYFLSVFRIFKWFPIDDYILVFSFLILAYAIIRHRLMEISVFAVRTLIFIIVYGIIFALPLFTFFASKSLIDKISTGIYALLTSVAPFIYLYLQHRTEDLLLKNQRRYQKALIDLSTTLTLIKDLDKLLRVIVFRVTREVKVDFACIYLTERNNGRLIQKFPYTTAGFFPDFPTQLLYESAFIYYLKKHHRPIFADELSGEIKREFGIRGGLIIPSFIRNKLLGFLMLGPKASGAIYTEEDATVFKILSNQVGLAIENTQFIKEFEEAQAKLREAEKLKGIAQMMHSLNHEFRNLFNNMRLAINFLLTTDDKQDMAGILEGIDENTQKGTDILEAVQFYASKSKSDELKPRRIDTVLNVSLELFKEKFQKANIKYTLNIQPNLPEIQTKDTFEDLFSNIFANSNFCFIELPQNHHKLIDIQAKLSEDKKTIQIIIQDTGRDITKSGYSSDPDSLFKERGKLGGVNLYLAYLITHDHNGKLTVDSYEKGGTIFKIEIPEKFSNSP